jgi:hypothetical protein
MILESARVLVLCLMFSAMGDGCAPHRAEVVERIPSPDRRVDALVLRAGVPPGGQVVFYVQVVSAGGDPKDREFDLFRADHVEAFRASWVSERMLELEFERARIFQFSNFWQSREVDDFGYQVELRLRPQNPTSLRDSPRR